MSKEIVRRDFEGQVVEIALIDDVIVRVIADDWVIEKADEGIDPRSPLISLFEAFGDTEGAKRFMGANTQAGLSELPEN